MDVAAGHLAEVARARILCVGDVMIDRAVEGAVDRVSPEAPIPVLRQDAVRSVPGGAGNVLANLAALGAEAAFVGLAGEDAEADELEALLAGAASGEVRLLRDAGRPTTLKTRFVAGNQQLLRVDRERAGPPDAATAGRLAEAATACLGSADLLVLSDYGKGVLSPATLRPLIEAARAAGKPVLVDPKGRDFARYAGATLVTPNRAELAVAAAAEVGDEAALAEVAAGLRDRIGIDWLLTTLGGAGMLLQGAGERHRIPGIRREVYDVVGAGDTVLAVMAALLAVACPVPAAAWLANLAGSLAVGRRGTAAIGDVDLRMALAALRGTLHEAKIQTAEEAARLVAQARRRGDRVGFTNGCFDILHPGHVSLVTQARAHCDLLVLGLNSDASVRRLKGPTRPVNDERARARVLAALSGVDAVVIFDEDTPLDLIGRLRPDVLVKGADYSIEQVVGAAEVHSWGGEVVLAGLVPDVSTTATIARIGRGG
ncbi:MAG TPA: D-glycero-beta-D-manno-heptose 1-phosphate adenylyltransferase [Geminicoccaceae bacterium]|nr:D-glycero-beta-D-manno-heptose 1-phosphate adenylyltransferase [Geminicoccus sp.]HMU50830.1 D-glycero-beta-D-manno-heptose 1-phosphate adenylyltransferase [Geminicoccaceae bacterium]